MGLLGAEAEQMAAVHRVGVEAIKAGSKSARVGWTLAIVDLQSAAGGEQRLDTVRRRAQLDWLDVSRDDDWVGVQTYSRQVLGADGPVPVADGTPTHQTGWEVYPEAIGNTVRLASAHSRVPIIVTENGIATDVDEDRIAHTRTALESLAECIDDGIDVRGYCHWSLLDNFEWMAGYTKDFGLVAVDPHTFERRVKPSARWLGEVAKANSLH